MLVMLLVVVVTAMLMSPANDNNNDKYVKFSGSHAELTDHFFPMADNDYEYCRISIQTTMKIITFFSEGRPQFLLRLLQASSPSLG